jgi:phage gp45-like
MRVRSEGAVEISCKTTSINNEEQCDMQSRKVNALGTLFQTFIWKACQSTFLSV